MQKLLFIGIAYHAKTRSCGFVLDRLEEQFDVTVCQVDQYQDDPFSALADTAGTYDVLVCWQIMPPRELLDAHIKWNHAALFPMYDSISEKGNPERWYPYRDFNIICFSRKLFERVSGMGFSAKYIQYFPKPSSIETWGGPRKVFFWARQESINCRTVETLLQYTDIEKIHVHRAMDPDEKFIEPDSGGSIEYSFSTWFEEKREMNQIINDSAFYIAPREREGIGMSFLEAMAVGRCVIAPDDSTMNEYIEHGKTGYLYDLNDPKPIRISDVKTVQQQTLSYIEEGYARWMKERDNIFTWLTTSPTVCRKRLVASMIRRALTRPQTVLKMLWENHV